LDQSPAAKIGIKWRSGSSVWRDYAGTKTAVLLLTAATSLSLSRFRHVKLLKLAHKYGGFVLVVIALTRGVRALFFAGNWAMTRTTRNETEFPDVLPTRGRVLAKAAAVYDWVQPFVTLGQETKLNHWVADSLALDGEEYVLDIGCGTGLLTVAIAERYPRATVVGIDASKPMIRVADRKRRRDNCNYRQALAEELPYDAETFDAVTSALFFHHVDRELKVRCLCEVLRVLKPGGRLIVADMDRPYTGLGRAMSVVAWRLFRQPEIKENMDGIMRSLIPEAGFVDMVELARFSGYISVLSARKPQV